jgi:hypothetical protein
VWQVHGFEDGGWRDRVWEGGRPSLGGEAGSASIKRKVVLRQ